MTCDRGRSQLNAYVDGALSAEEAMALEAHLIDCPACTAEYRALREVVDTLRGAKPLYRSPDSGRAAVRRLVDAHTRRRRLTLWAGAAAGCALAACLAVLAVRWGQAAPFDRFVGSAIETHLRYARGSLALDYRSGDGPAVSAWLGERLPFRTALPNYPVQAGAPPRYTMVGARVLPFEGHNLGYVAYEMNGKPISLLMAESSVAPPVGGRVMRSGGLRFHLVPRQGLQLIAWTDRGLNYALVSDVQAPAAGSCVVCHGAERERHKIENLER